MGALCQADPSPGQRSPRTVKSGRYASYWNTFLFFPYFMSSVHVGYGLRVRKPRWHRSCHMQWGNAQWIQSHQCLCASMWIKTARLPCCCQEVSRYHTIDESEKSIIHRTQSMQARTSTLALNPGQTSSEALSSVLTRRTNVLQFLKRIPQKPMNQEEEVLNEDLVTGYSRKMTKGGTTNIPKLSLVFCRKDLSEGENWWW